MGSKLLTHNTQGIDGAVIGGMTANQTESAMLINGRDTAGIFVQSLLGITAQYPAQRQYLDSRLRKTGLYSATEFHMAVNMSVGQSLEHYLYQNVYQYFEGGEDDVFAPPIRELMDREGTAGRQGTPRMSVFVHHALNDEMCPSESVDRLLDLYCDDGANIYFQKNVIGGHNRQLGDAQKMVVAYLTDIAHGTNVKGYPAKVCKR